MNDSYMNSICEDDHIDPALSKKILEQIPDEDAAVDAADLFAQLADSTRVRLLCMLSLSDLCVCEMADMLHMSQPAVSHHLRSLRQSGIVKFHKEGKKASYYLSPDETGNTVRKLVENICMDRKREENA